MKQEPPKDNLYLQFWRNPIYYGGLLTDVSAENWHTFTALAVFINDKGECYPSLSKLKQVLGLSGISSVSKRISNLAKARHNGEPLIEIRKRKQMNKQGTSVFANNLYILNPHIVTIFAVHEATTARAEQQTRSLEEIKAKFLKSHSVGEKRDDDNLTRRNF